MKKEIMLNLTLCSETAHFGAQYLAADVPNRPQTYQKYQIIPSGSLWCQIGNNHLSNELKMLRSYKVENSALQLFAKFHAPLHTQSIEVSSPMTGEAR